jgi:hypothetical protein
MNFYRNANCNTLFYILLTMYENRFRYHIHSWKLGIQLTRFAVHGVAVHYVGVRSAWLACAAWRAWFGRSLRLSFSGTKNHSRIPN